MKKLPSKISQGQRASLQHLLAAGTTAARTIMPVHILLKAESSEQGPKWSDEQIHEAFGAGKSSSWRVRRRFVEYGLDDALTRRPQPERPTRRKWDGEKEAHLLALTGGEKPEAEGRWSVRLLAEKLVTVGEVDEISHETVRQAVKKIPSPRG